MINTTAGSRKLNSGVQGSIESTRKNQVAFRTICTVKAAIFTQRFPRS